MKHSKFVDTLIEKYIRDEELKRLLITHSACVASKAVATAESLNLLGLVDLQFLIDASMLHDIGVVRCDAPSIFCHGSLPYICHGVAGGDILRREGLDERYARVCERHTGSGLTVKDIMERNLPLPHKELVPETLEEKLICFADKFYSKSGDPSEEKSRDRVLNSLRRHGEESVKRFLELEHELKTAGQEHDHQLS